ncbi:uncharacterized protein LOC115883113 [Sitophilus oryzae]|uniref:Uncharacterized protein LOC115883113 n=1 Tax=Sitophilus oryzae TaxID=7048 RepID=A0A6J2Y2Q9_SITOR|nr:uncharacterized protein LOC115883113 [Sitophilus oryzae]
MIKCNEGINILNEDLKKISIETKVSKKTVIKKYTGSKTVKTGSRKKRSRKAYFKSLKKRRSRKRTDKLSTGVQECTVVDMEMVPVGEANNLQKDIIEWHQQDTLSYWKSRAISLEIENRMLHEHLRNVYAQQLDYGNNVLVQNTKTGTLQNYCTQSLSTKEYLDSNTEPIDKNKHLYKNDKLEGLKQGESVKISNKVPEGQHRLNKMKSIYGNNAPKIMGMETAIQLNFEHLKEGSYSSWPNIPLKI